jgi:chorismate synthase
MANLSYHTAGESHGPGMVAIVEGLPSGLPIDRGRIDAALGRRQRGYGRGARQRIERDEVEFLAGLRQGRTGAGPLAMLVRNRDCRLDDPLRTPPIHRPRPGHADLAGSLKHLTPDCRDAIERSSARETAARVAAGAAASCLLAEFGIESFGFVRGALDLWCPVEATEENWRQLRELRDASEVAIPDEASSQALAARIRDAKVDGDTVGGWIEVAVFGVPPGLGSSAAWHTRLDSRLGAAVLGVQAMKAVEIGLGREVAARRGSQVHDPILFDASARQAAHLGFGRPSNHAGGLEGGITNGMPVVVRAAMKPISTLLQGLPSVDLRSGDPERSDYERSDVCAVAAASVVVEQVVAFEIARALREKFGGDSLEEMRGQFEAYLAAARRIPPRGA